MLLRIPFQNNTFLEVKLRKDRRNYKKSSTRLLHFAKIPHGAGLAKVFCKILGYYSCRDLLRASNSVVIRHVTSEFYRRYSHKYNLKIAAGKIKANFQTCSEQITTFSHVFELVGSRMFALLNNFITNR